MKTFMKFGMAILAMTIGVAFVGVPASSATSTQLCKTHDALTCPPGEGATDLHAVSTAVTSILSGGTKILCLESLLGAIPLALGAPQKVHTAVWTFTGCGTTPSHSNCKLTVTNQPLFDLLKIGLDLGDLTATSGELNVACEDYYSFIDIDCYYNIEGMLFTVSNSELVANKAVLKESGWGSPWCYDEVFLDTLLTSLDNVYVVL